MSNFCSSPLLAGIKIHFYRIPVSTENQLRHPALWTEKLLDSWIFCSKPLEPTIVRLAGPQLVSRFNKSYIHLCIYIYIYSFYKLSL
ncbi:rCG23906 [Rattus norvegicus]|uniref:RCG23906 n=1 Tax=Rattus norvegicus TaxID=10116 RepID=A6JWF1_RAT|nr:rCG23906 [Rattus norvegicus]